MNAGTTRSAVSHGTLLALVAVSLVLFACSGAEPRPDSTVSSLEPTVDEATQTLLDACEEQNAIACTRAGILFAQDESKSDPAKARDLFRRACELKDRDGCFNLARMLETGLGGPEDVEAAGALYNQSCDLGHAPSCNNLAVLLTRSGHQDQAQVLQQRACERGDGRACFNLGFQLEQSTVSNPAAASAYYRQACALNYVEGCYYLGFLYRYGRGVDKDTERGTKLYEQACEASYARACSSLGSILQRGDGVEVDAALAREYFQRACDLGFARGCTNLGLSAPSVDPSPEGARASRPALTSLEWLQKGCDSEDAKGCSRLGIRYLKGDGVEKDFGRARQLFEKSCELSYQPGCSNLGVLFEDGLGVDKDLDRARSLYREACDADEPQGCHNLAGMYEDGRGVDEDFAEATDLYMKSCEAGIAFSCSYLGSRWLEDDDKRRFGVELLERGCSEGDDFGCETLESVKSER